MSNNAPPSRNPTSDDSLLGVFNVVLRKFLQQQDDMLPAKVIAFNRSQNIVQLQPQINMVTTINEVVARASLDNITVLTLGGGLAGISFNLNPGDTGWLKANDRDISIYKQNYEQGTPATGRMHSFEDAIFIPDVAINLTIASEDMQNAVFQRADGTVRISLWENLIKMTAPQIAMGDVSGFTPRAGALLDLQSTDKALGVPTMTTTQKNAISASPGFVVFDTTLNRLSVYSSGTGWS